MAGGVIQLNTGLAADLAVTGSAGQPATPSSVSVVFVLQPPDMSPATVAKLTGAMAKIRTIAARNNNPGKARLFAPTFAGAEVGTLLIVGFTLMGLTFGPMGAELPELFPTNVRYTGSAVAYNLSSVLGAAVAPTIAVWLWTIGGGSTFWVGVYLSLAGVLTLIALLLSKETKDVDFADNVS